MIVCFLYSFLNDAHERRAKALVQSVLPDAYVSCSSEVVNVIREYERFSTTAMNAFVGPKTALYLNNLESKLRDAGINAHLRIMQSNGGVSTVEMCAQRPVSILMSGLAGGVMGGRWAGAMSDVRDVITVDIGGTSADFSTIPDGQVKIMNPRDTYVGAYPVLAPMIDMATMGAGGGSIAYIDEGGAFRVGPRSAGADPGPACYGRGGTEPTVTDAQVVLGRLDPDQFLGGGVKIDPELAHRAIEEKIARPLGMSDANRRSSHPGVSGGRGSAPVQRGAGRPPAHDAAGAEPHHQGAGGVGRRGAARAHDTACRTDQCGACVRRTLPARAHAYRPGHHACPASGSGQYRASAHRLHGLRNQRQFARHRRVVRQEVSVDQHRSRPHAEYGAEGSHA